MKKILLTKEAWLRATTDITGKFYCPVDMQGKLLDVWPEGVKIEINL